MEIIHQTKRCGKCHEEKTIEAFHRHAGMADGRQRVCRACRYPNARPPPTLAERLAAKTNRDGPSHPALGTPCWLWAGVLNASGYGVLCVGGKHELAHRAAWRLAHDILTVPDGLCVLHRCDNPPCCNPAHLFLGTKSDNTADMMTKGRHRSVTSPQTIVRGERHGCAKLTREQVDEIRASYRPGVVTLRELGERYGIHTGTVGNIVAGRGWK